MATLSIDAESSPRIITVLAPDTEITIQELVDLIRDWEDDLAYLEYDELIDATGKDQLAEGITTAITLTLKNAKLAFEARPGPGFVRCDVTGGNMVAVDELGDPMDPIETTAYCFVVVVNQSGGVIATSSGDVEAISAGVWNRLTSQLTAVGSIGKKVNDNVDVAISTRAMPGDPMGLTNSSITSDVLDPSAITEIQNGLARTGDLMGLTPSAITAETLTEDAVEEIQLGLARPGDQMDLVANAIDDTKIAANARRYQSKVWMTDDDTGNADRYIVVFFKDSQPTTTGITVPKIQVIKISDGTDLIPLTTLTQIGSLGLYKHEEATRRMLSGYGYIIKVTATIDGATRTWFQPMSRDSS